MVVLLAALACRLGAQTPEQPAPPATTVQPTATRQQTSFPFRVCELSSHGDLFRFSSDIQCPSFGTRENHTEGLLMVFKDNIIPYSFKVRSYTKIVTNILIYNGWYADSVTNRHEEKFSVESYETDQMDTIYQCYNAVKMTKDGLARVYVDRDGVNITVNLKPTGGLANGVRRYASQTELYDAPGWLIWTYRTRTTVNCLITDMMAKSNSPFDFFVTTTGQTVEMSPFYDGKNTETFHERADSFHVRTNYKIVDYDNRGTNPQGERRAFLDKGTYTLSWKLENRTAYCPLQHWQTFDSTIATETGKSIHFVTDEGTSSFVTNTTVGIELPDAFKCIEEQVNKTMHEKYEAVQDRYTKGQEAITYFITSGGLLLAWLPLTPLRREGGGAVRLQRLHRVARGAVDPAAEEPLRGPGSHGVKQVSQPCPRQRLLAGPPHQGQATLPGKQEQGREAGMSATLPLPRCTDSMAARVPIEELREFRHLRGHCREDVVGVQRSGRPLCLRPPRARDRALLWAAQRINSVFYCMSHTMGLESLERALDLLGRFRGVSPIPDPRLYITSVPCWRCVGELMVLPNHGNPSTAEGTHVSCNHLAVPVNPEPVSGLFENEVRQAGLGHLLEAEEKARKSLCHLLGTNLHRLYAPRPVKLHRVRD